MHKMTEKVETTNCGNRVPYADPGAADHRGPWRYLWWLVVMQRGRVLMGALWGSLWMCALMLPPYLIARAIDDGLQGRDTRALVLWSGAVLALGATIACLGLLRHRTMTMIRIDAAYRTVQVVVRQVTRLGAQLPDKVSVGELTHLQAGDIGRIAQTLTITGPGVGAVVAYATTAAVLFTISGVLAAVVLIGVPLLAIAVGPLLGKLHGAEGAYREKQGALTAGVVDIVSGLSVLSGVGGKPIFARRYRRQSREVTAEGYRVATFTSWVQAIGAGLPVIFLAVVTWIAARMAAAGAISVGEMVAVYGYVAALLVPISFFIEGADDLPRGLVAARRVVNILALRPDELDPRAQVAVPEPATAQLHDPTSGVVLHPGELAALVSARPEEARAVVERLGRLTESAATWGGVPLANLPTAEVRRHILVSDNDAYLFGGQLQAAVSAQVDSTEAEVRQALRVAVAEDVVAAMPAGLSARLEANGRNVSGGQRQRLRLVRALLADPAVLMLVEPTSALDAHTEATVATRVREARRGRTTLVVSTSPLLLDHADRVHYLVDGAVAAVGTHGELLATQPGYRRLVFRGSDDSRAAATAAGQEGLQR